jgi:hypothetical protein
MSRTQQQPTLLFHAHGDPIRVAPLHLPDTLTADLPGVGWYDDVHGEIGDICAWQTKQVGGYTVQLEWSNRANTCV